MSSMIWAATLGYAVLRRDAVRRACSGRAVGRRGGGCWMSVAGTSGAASVSSETGEPVDGAQEPKSRTKSFDIPDESAIMGRRDRRRAMGVEGKDRAKVLEAGAAAVAVEPARARRPAAAQELRPVARRPLGPVRRRQVDHFPDRAQRDQSDADHHLAARPCARRVDRIDPAGRRGGTVHRTSEPRHDADLRFRRRTVPSRGDRLAEDRRLAAMVRFSGRSRRRARIRAPTPRGSVECLSVLEGELEVDVGGSKEIAREGETLRYRCDRPHRIRNPRDRPRMRRWSASSRLRRWIDPRNPPAAGAFTMSGESGSERLAVGDD